MTPEEVKIFESYRVKAEAGDAESQFHLGMCYDKGFGVQADKYKGVAWYLKASRQEHAAAQNNLGASYFLGEGVAHKDEAQAVFWYRKSAEHGFASAQFALGLCCLEGRGCPKDEVQAAQWFMKAAIQGDAEAEYRLARCYELGLGLKKDSERAIIIYEMAALGGHEYAQVYLGDYYLKMAGIAKQVEAYAYYALASGTLEVAQERIAVLSKRMSEDALLLGKNRAAQLRDQSRQRIAEIKLKQEQAGK